MLKQIAVSDLQVGMFVHKFEGSWFEHPFWKAKFLVEDDERLAEIKESRLRTLVIDTEKGIDLTPASGKATPAGAAPQPSSPEVRRIKSIKKRTAVQLESALPVSMSQEVETASVIAEQARERLDKIFVAARLGRALDVRKVEPVVVDILASVRRNPQAFSSLMRCKLKNEDHFRHALSVSALMVAMADRMKLSGPEIHTCGLAGLLLDIGVNYLPQSVDPWVGGRRQQDQRAWESHVMLGYRALLNDGDMPQAVLDACLFHHERFDGTGYPQHRAGEDIPQIARMAAICDSFEFMLGGSTTRNPLDPASAVAALKEQTGAFDEDLLRVFIETVGFYPVGAFVVLASNKLAMVIDEDRNDPMKPVVQAFYSFETRERILPHRIVLAESGDTDRILSVADLAGLDLPPDAQLRELVFLSACRSAAIAA